MKSAAPIELHTKDEVRAAANSEPNAFIPPSFYLDKMVVSGRVRLSVDQLPPSHVVFGLRAMEVMLASYAGRTSYMPRFDAKPLDLWIGYIHEMNVCFDRDNDLIDPDLVIIISRKRSNPDQFTTIKFLADPMMR